MEPTLTDKLLDKLPPLNPEWPEGAINNWLGVFARIVDLAEREAAPRPDLATITITGDLPLRPPAPATSVDPASQATADQPRPAPAPRSERAAANSKITTAQIESLRRLNVAGTTARQAAAALGITEAMAGYHLTRIRKEAANQPGPEAPFPGPTSGAGTSASTAGQPGSAA